jgi:hypothetical protein
MNAAVGHNHRKADAGIEIADCGDRRKADQWQQPAGSNPPNTGFRSVGGESSEV